MTRWSDLAVLLWALAPAAAGGAALMAEWPGVLGLYYIQQVKALSFRLGSAGKRCLATRRSKRIFFDDYYSNPNKWAVWPPFVFHIRALANVPLSQHVKLDSGRTCGTVV